MDRNSVSFYDLVGGQYGRTTAYTSYDTVTLDNVVKIVSDTIGIHNRNREAIMYLWRYYKGDQPIHYRVKRNAPRDDIVNKIVENHAYEFVQFKVSQSYGEPVQLVSLRDDEQVNKSVDVYNDYMAYVDVQSTDVRMGEYQSAVGVGFQAVQYTGNPDKPFRIVAPNPLNTYVVYNEQTEEPILSVQTLKDDNKQIYYFCHSVNMQYKIQNGKVVDYRLHTYGDIPIVEFPNNWSRLSEIELVIDILDGVNNIQSNRIDGVEQFVSSWVVFENVDIDDTEFQKMKASGAIAVKTNSGVDNKASVKLLTHELDQNGTQTTKEDLLKNATSILAIPDKEKQNSGGDSQGAVELRAGWDFSKARGKLKDTLIKKSKRKIAKIVNNVLRVSGKGLNLNPTDYDVQINHSPTDNMVVKCQSLQYLLQCGIHPIVAIKTVQLWGDAEKVFLLSKPYLDNLWKTYEQAQQEGQVIQAQALLSEFNNNKTETSEEL